MASRSYSKLVKQYHRDYPHTVIVQNGREWRDKALSNAHYAATGGPLVQWFEDGQTVYGFKTAEQAAAFKGWVDTCGIEWTKDPRNGPIPDFVKPPERPIATLGYSGHAGGPTPDDRGTPERVDKA